MGGDHGPAVIVEGAADAVREFGASVILVGNRDAIERELARLNAGNLGLEIRHASQVVEMAESPSQALRRKRDSSLRIAAELVRSGGDRGPAVIVEGAADAVREFGASVILVGNRDAIERELARLNAGNLGLEIRHASQVVEMAESPSQALRRKRDSSLRIAAELVRGGRASAVI